MKTTAIVRSTWDREAFNVQLLTEDVRDFEQVRTVRDLETGLLVSDETTRETKVVAAAGCILQFAPPDPKALAADPAAMAAWKAQFDTEDKIVAKVRAHPQLAKATADLAASIAQQLAKANVKPEAPKRIPL